MNKTVKNLVSSIVLITFSLTSLVSPRAFAQGLPALPKPGVMVGLSPAFAPPLVKALVIHPDNPMAFDFLIDQGDVKLPQGEKQGEYQRLIKYFLASLAIPEEELWVNLSPYEKQRIIPDTFGKTEMGRDLLAMDYMLKQITASLIYPEDGFGKVFWDRIYKEAYEKFGTTNVPVNTFNKVWIVPDVAQVYERGNTVFLVKSHLKVMLEEDYLAMEKSVSSRGGEAAVAIPSRLPSNEGLNMKATQGAKGSQAADVNNFGSQIVREILLPAIEQEVNEGKNFATLRQINNSLILATWYKKALKDSLLGKVYADKGKVSGLSVMAQAQPLTPDAIYQQYLKAFKKGVFNYIKEDVDRYTQESIPRKYFSGGFGTILNRLPASSALPETHLGERITKASQSEAMAAIKGMSSGVEDLALVALTESKPVKEMPLGAGFNRTEVTVKMPMGSLLEIKAGGQKLQLRVASLGGKHLELSSGIPGDMKLLTPLKNGSGAYEYGRKQNSHDPSLAEAHFNIIFIDDHNPKGGYTVTIMNLDLTKHTLVSIPAEGTASFVPPSTTTLTAAMLTRRGFIAATGAATLAGVLALLRKKKPTIPVVETSGVAEKLYTIDIVRGQGAQSITIPEAIFDQRVNAGDAQRHSTAELLFKEVRANQERIKRSEESIRNLLVRAQTDPRLMYEATFQEQKVLLEISRLEHRNAFINRYRLLPYMKRILPDYIRNLKDPRNPVVPKLERTQHLLEDPSDEMVTAELTARHNLFLMFQGLVATKLNNLFDNKDNLPKVQESLKQLKELLDLQRTAQTEIKALFKPMFESAQIEKTTLIAKKKKSSEETIRLDRAINRLTVLGPLATNPGAFAYSSTSRNFTNYFIQMEKVVNLLGTALNASNDSKRRVDAWNKAEAGFKFMQQRENEGKAIPASKAMLPDVGGINLNPAMQNLQIKRDGAGVPLPVSQQDIEHIMLDGLIPVIKSIIPAAESPIFSEIFAQASSSQAS